MLASVKTLLVKILHKIINQNKVSITSHFSRMTKFGITVLAAALAACPVFAQSKTFKAVSLNVDGLPASLLGGIVKMNPDGPQEAGTTAFGTFIREQRPDWDVFALSEDFNFEDELRAALNPGNEVNYSFGTHRGKMYNKVDVLTSPFDTDGLNVMVRNASGISFSGEQWVRFTDSYGKTGNGSDELIKKGFRYYLLDFGNGLQCDLYMHHMDAETDAQDNAARESNVKQLIKYILDSNTTRPVLIMGDSNCRYTRDNLQEWVFNTVNNYTVNGEKPYQVRDPWVDFQWQGVAPALGSPSLMVGSYGSQRGEVVDKIWYINNKNAGGVKLVANSYLRDADFKQDGVNFPDHQPIVVEFTISAGNSDVFVPDPERTAIEIPFAANTTHYLRNMEKGLYLTGGGYWDVQAMVDDCGYGFTVMAGADPLAIKLKNVNTTGYLGDNLYVDNGNGADWYFTKVNGTKDIYTLATKINGQLQYLTAAENNDQTPYYCPEYKATLEAYRPGDHRQQWEIITETERDNRMIARDYAHPELWQDVTYKIPSFNFPNNDAQIGRWKTETNSRSSAHAGVVSQNQQNGIMYRFYNDYTLAKDSKTTVSTTINGLRNGKYRFKVQVYNDNLNTDKKDLNFCITAGNSKVYPDPTPNATKIDTNLGIPGAYFREGKGWVTVDNINVTNGTLYIEFQKKHTKSETCFCLDNMRLEYLPEDKPATDKVEVNIDFPEHYNTMILPFDLSDSEVKGMINDKLVILRIKDMDDLERNGEKYHKVQWQYQTSVKANIPYLVVNEGVQEVMPVEQESNTQKVAAQANDAKVYTFSGHPKNTNYYYNDPEDAKKVLTGAFVDTYVYPEHYSLETSVDKGQTFAKNTGDAPVIVPAYRAYVNKHLTPAAEYNHIVFNDTNRPTGVEEVAVDSEDAPVEIYTLSGIRVPMENLTPGFYIRRQGRKATKILVR